MSARPRARIGRRSRWLIAELDARGEIDEHAAMCLRLAIEGACASGADAVVVDLRDLTAIDFAGLRVLTQAKADCVAGGIELGVLIRGDAQHAAIVHACVAVGLVDHLQFAASPSPSPSPPPSPSPSAPAPPARARTGAARDIRAAAFQFARPQFKWPWRP